MMQEIRVITTPHRMKTKRIYVGDVPIGGGAPVVVQSMTNTPTTNVKRTLEQIRALRDAGCEIVRVAVPSMDSIKPFSEIVSKSDIPVIADIHFDPQIALHAIRAGAKGIRINPGNISGRSSLKKILREAKNFSIPIRIGINSGSLPKEILKRYGHPTPEALVDAAIHYIRIFEDMDFSEIKLSLKSSSVLDTIKAYEMISERTDYPLHLGITEAGPIVQGTVKSSIGIGILLLKGIGDTIRVSLTADPVQEVKVAYEILRAVGLRQYGPEIISCPVCGRCEIDIMGLVNQVCEGINGIKAPIKVAIMGCVVNGPGEAREADVGVAGGRGKGILFKKGEVIRKIPEGDLARVLINEVKEMEKSYQREVQRR